MTHFANCAVGICESCNEERELETCAVCGRLVCCRCCSQMHISDVKEYFGNASVNLSILAKGSERKPLPKPDDYGYLVVGYCCD